MSAAHVDRGPGHTSHEGFERAICIAVITMAIRDLQTARTNSWQYSTAVSFFRSPTSHWSWMQAALEDVEPGVVEAQAEKIISEREALASRCTREPSGGHHVSSKARRAATARRSRVQRRKGWEREELADLDLWDRGQRVVVGEEIVGARDPRLN